MSRAAVTLCVDLRHDVPGYWSDRLWLALGAGACIVKRFTEGEPRLPYLSYLDSSELVEHVGRCVADFDYRQSMGRDARRAVMAGHTYRHRAERLLSQTF